jgi:hypothetical protein
MRDVFEADKQIALKWQKERGPLTPHEQERFDWLLVDLELGRQWFEQKVYRRARCCRRQARRVACKLGIKP